MESHTSFGKAKMSGDIEHKSLQVEKSLLEFKLKQYNQFFNEKCPANVVKSRERNGRLILEGSLRLYWDVSNKIHLKEDHDNRIMVIRRKTSYHRVRNGKKRAKSECEQEREKNRNSNPFQTVESSSSSDNSPTNEEVTSIDDLGRNFKTLPNQTHQVVPMETKRKSKSFDDEYINLHNNVSCKSLNALRKLM